MAKRHNITRTSFQSLTFTVLIGLLVFISNSLSGLDGSLWDFFSTNEDALHHFCEHTFPERFIRQPSNTYSNLFYLFTAAFMWFSRSSVTFRKWTYLSQRQTWLYFYISACLMTFAGSSFFHASLTVFAEWWDLAAVYMTLTVPLFYNMMYLARGRNEYQRSGTIRVVIWSLITGISWLTIFRISAHFMAPALFFSLIGTAMIILFKTRDKRYIMPAILSTIMSGVAVMFFVFDIKRIGCMPDAIYQPHSAWHACTALAALSYFEFMQRLQA